MAKETVMRCKVGGGQSAVGSGESADREALNNERRGNSSAHSSFIIHHSAFRPAFTLVELMMVLIIVGLLVSLLTVAVSYAIKAANRTKIVTEISNLDMAMQNYKNQYTDYPPSMAVSAAVASTTRSSLFERALRQRFPRYTGNYATLNAALTNTSTGWKVVMSSSATPKPINLDLLDPAEAIVFWLAGLPTPVSAASTSSSRLFGFSPNPTNPFDMTTPQNSRQQPLFQFDETRLTDVDGDGWLEYAPAVTTNNKLGVPPYVYFDSNSYTYNDSSNNQYFACYPGSGSSLAAGDVNASQPLSMSTASGAALLAELGFITPYATALYKTADAPAPAYVGNVKSWWNPKKFQIISCGLDAEYGGSQYDPIPPIPPARVIISPAINSVPVVPQTSSQGTVLNLTQGDNDNLTNFTDSTIEDYVPK